MAEGMELLRQLLTPDLRGFGNALLLFLPPLLILGNTRARWWSRLLWMLATQLAWAFVALYAWVRAQRYLEGEAALDSAQRLAELPPLSDAIGWWSYAFPWLVYLLFRATHLPPPKKRPRRRRKGESAAVALPGENPP
ncbi:MAG TPA: hypothetical protein VLI06_02030 [Solimonas sp.]|nr:hypothetical protein [Solimonas sp.]